MRHQATKNRNGFSLLELVIVIAIIGILVAILLPMRRGGSHLAARRIQCMNNIRQIALASLNYESAHMKFPLATGIEMFQGVGSADQYSGLVAILPYIEQADIYDKITEGGEFNGVKIEPCPPLYSKTFPTWKEAEIIGYRCPSASSSYKGFPPTHYGYCIGDRARNIAQPNSYRGAFGSVESFGYGKIDDGTSNTIMAGEISSVDGGTVPFAVDQKEALLENPAKCWKLVEGSEGDWNFKSDVSLNQVGRGGHWADGQAGIGLFNTILPPQSPSAAVGGSEGVDGIYSAGGPHPGTVNIAFCDGSTHSISNDIDAGDSSHPVPTEEEMATGAPSPYGVWGALGTINGGEVVDDF